MTSPRPRLLLATHNSDKVREIRKILKGLLCQVLGLDSFPSYTVKETGKTLEANALLKAKKAVRQTGLPAAADDTGLEVPALNGAPGVISARFAGSGCTYADNCRKILRVMKNIPPKKRRARFRTVVALAWPNGPTRLFEGTVQGVISLEAKGSRGFGYDPVFIPRGGGGKTFAEMSLNQKNAISHRFRAFQKLKNYLMKHPAALK